MDDDNGLELSLGLSFGGSNAKLKGKDDTASDLKTEGGGSTTSLKGNLNNFLNTSTDKQDVEDGSQRSDAAQSSKENFFTNLSKPGHVSDASADSHVSNSPQLARFGELWDANNESEVQEVKFDHDGNGGKMWMEVGNKRKMLFEEMNNQKKHEREVQHADAHGKKSVGASHVSVTTGEGSTAENEDVAESGVDGSTLGLVLNHENGTRNYNSGGCGSSEVIKERYGQTRSNTPPANDPRLVNMTYGSSLPQMNVQYSLSSKMSGFNGEPNTSGFPSPSVMQMRPSARNEGPVSQVVNPCNSPLTFGYPPLQLPTLNNERSWGLMSHPMQIPSSYAGRNISNGVQNSDRSEDGSNTTRAVIQASPHRSSEAFLDERSASELAKSVGRQQNIETNMASSSIPTEDQIKGNRTKVTSYHNQPVGGIIDGLAIRPGIAPGLKFGGCGSYPELPWVSTTAPGPDGRTISGVTYKDDKNQVRIVCACHGSHMSPKEFVQHASAGQQNSENDTGVTSFTNGNPAASTQS